MARFSEFPTGASGQPAQLSYCSSCVLEAPHPFPTWGRAIFWNHKWNRSLLSPSPPQNCSSGGDRNPYHDPRCSPRPGSSASHMVLLLPHCTHARPSSAFQRCPCHALCTGESPSAFLLPDKSGSVVLPEEVLPYLHVRANPAGVSSVTHISLWPLHRWKLSQSPHQLSC